jgi:hypothetical protein
LLQAVRKQAPIALKWDTFLPLSATFLAAINSIAHPALTLPPMPKRSLRSAKRNAVTNTGTSKLDVPTIPLFDPAKSKSLPPSKGQKVASSVNSNPFELRKYDDNVKPLVASESQKSITIPDCGHSAVKTTNMDPFEVRIRFTQHLQHLNASVTSANKAAQYALKYKDMDEDLHSCILEQLERVTPPQPRLRTKC